MNSSLGAPFALVRIFRISQTPSLVSILKILTNTKFPPQILELDSNKSESSLRDSATPNRSNPNKTKSARSANPCLTPSLLKATKSPKYPLKSFCYFLLLQKVESPLPSNFNPPNKADFTNPTQQTIEGIAVEVAEFLPNLGRETRLGVCERPKFGKSMQDAPKRELQKEIAYDS